MEADGYLQGLEAAGVLTADGAAAARERLRACLNRGPGLQDVFLPMAWIAVVSAITFACNALAIDPRMVAVLVVFAALAGGLWGSSRPWLARRNETRLSRWERPICVIAMAIFAPFAAFEISLAVGEGLKALSIYRFDKDRTAFETDAKGFAMLRKLAREEFGVEVLLGNANQSWASTTLRLPNASVASMEVGAGYCQLNFHRENVLRGFEPIGKVDRVAWVQGVMMHEFAHCLDISRDTPAFGDLSAGVRSIAPVDGAQVSTLESWLTVGAKPASQLWREAVADVMVVGYWKLVAPTTSAALVWNLRLKRASPKEDAAHSTGCWIDFAEKAEPPSSTKDLFEWADSLRRKAPCRVASSA